MDEQTTIRRTGRAKGAKDTKPRKKREHNYNTIDIDSGENARYLTHDLKLLQLPLIDVNNLDQVTARIADYFRICAEDDIKPSMASFALAFGVSRITLFNWLTGRTQTITNTQCFNSIKRAYNTINSYYEHMMNNGKINPVAGIFLMKNNMGYKDTTDYVVSSGNGNDLTLEDISNRAGLLSDG